MTNIGAGEIIDDLRKKIQMIQLELEELGDPVENIPEMINSANLLRSNEYLSKSNEKRSALIEVYGQYCATLEELLKTVFDIQKDLKDILKEQSTLISKSSKSKKK